MASKCYPPGNTASAGTSNETLDNEHARALKRAKARHVEAEKRKEVVRSIASSSVSRRANRFHLNSCLNSHLEGSAHFRTGKGEHRKATGEYEAATRIHGPSLAYLSNMAVAWLEFEA